LSGGSGERAARWDRRYAAAEGGLFGEAPCALLSERMARERPASALLLADGDGRNGTWLAARGTPVTAVDLSPEAVRRALGRDRAAGVAAERLVADIAEWTPEPGRRWAMAGIFYLHGPAPLRRRALTLARGALAPGGLLLLEGFARPRLAGQTIGPEDAETLYAAAELAAWCPDLGTERLWQGAADLDEGPRHAGRAAVLRWVARWRA